MLLRSRSLFLLRYFCTTLNRGFHSYATLLFYYIGASWPLIPGARTFLGAGGSIIEGILICLGASALLAIPAALLFTQNRTVRPFASPLCSFSPRFRRWELLVGPHHSSLLGSCFRAPLGSASSERLRFFHSLSLSGAHCDSRRGSRTHCKWDL